MHWWVFPILVGSLHNFFLLLLDLANDHFSNCSNLCQLWMTSSTYIWSSKFQPLQHLCSHVITIWVLSNQLGIPTVAESRDHAILICQFPCWLPTSKVNGTAQPTGSQKLQLWGPRLTTYRNSLNNGSWELPELLSLLAQSCVYLYFCLFIYMWCCTLWLHPLVAENSSPITIIK